MAHGFRFALVDFVPGSPGEGLLDLVRVVKINVRDLDVPELVATVKRLRDLVLIASGVDTRVEYDACRELGFDGYQGRFFAEPLMLTGKSAPTHRLRALSMLVQRGEATSFEQLERVITEDPGLSHKLVRLANSAFFGVRRPIGSIHDALLQLGSVVVRRWAMLLMLASVTDRPTHLLEVGLLRARLCQMVAAHTPGAEPERAFTAGLFSVVPSLVGMTMSELLDELPFDERMSAALLDHVGPEGIVLGSVLAYEVGDFATCATTASASWPSPAPTATPLTGATTPRWPSPSLDQHPDERGRHGGRADHHQERRAQHERQHGRGQSRGPRVEYESLPGRERLRGDQRREQRDGSSTATRCTRAPSSTRCGTESPASLSA